jgi:enoyl-CoA hydratase/carnithine racemase
MQTDVRYEQDEDLGTLILECDEPGKPTTLDLKVLDAMDAHLAELETRQDDLRALLIRSAIPKYFLVGANIEALKMLDEQTIVNWVRRGHAVLNRLAALPLPVIALVEGYALGGGLELALACDFIVATEAAQFGQPEARLGLVSGWGGSYRLTERIGLSGAKALFFTGKILDAKSAYQLGLVDFVGDAAEVEAYLDAFMDDLRACTSLAVAQMKWLLNRSLGSGDRAEAADAGTQVPEWNCADEVTASQVCMADAATKARVAAYLESREQ